MTAAVRSSKVCHLPISRASRSTSTQPLSRTFTSMVHCVEKACAWLRCSTVTPGYLFLRLSGPHARKLCNPRCLQYDTACIAAQSTHVYALLSLLRVACARPVVAQALRQPQLVCFGARALSWEGEESAVSPVRSFVQSALYVLPLGTLVRACLYQQSSIWPA